MDHPLQTLYELHLIDDRIHQARQGLAALEQPHPVAVQLERINAELVKYDAALRKARAELQDVELQLRSTEQKRKQDHDKLYGGTIVGTKELQALEREVESLGRMITGLEEKVLAAMEKVEPIQKNVDKLHNYKKAAEEKLAVIHTDQEKDRKRFKAELTRAEPLRTKAVKKVEPSLLQLYDLIRSSRVHPGMAVVEGVGCGQCHTAIPMFILRELRDGKYPIQCDNCRRIYYYPPPA